MNTKRFELNERKLLDHARKSIDGDDVLSALRWANKADRLFGVTDHFGFQEIYADAYESAGIVEAAIKHWFYALDCASEDDLNEVYEGLGVCFDQQGDVHTSAYYYEKLLRRMKWSQDEIKNFIAELGGIPSPVKQKARPTLVADADFSKEYLSGMDEMRSGNFSKAIRHFSAIPKGAKDHSKAINFIAISSLMDGDVEGAVQTSEEARELYPTDIEILVTLATTYKASGRLDEAIILCKRLTETPDLSNEEMFKISALCCELELHSLAFEYTKKLERTMPYDGNLMYMEGASAMNAGRIEEGIEVLERLRTVYPEAAVVDYYLSYYKNGGTDKMCYIYRLPEAERKKREDEINSIFGIEKEDLPLFLETEYARVKELIAWCFDEMDGQDMHLQAAAVSLLLFLGSEELIDELLLNYEVEDVVKTEIIRELCLQNKDLELRLVCFNLYQVLSVKKLHLGRKARKKFLEGYSICISQFALRLEGISEILPEKIETLYRKLEERNALDLVKNGEAVAAVVCHLAGMRKEREALHVLSLLIGADPSEAERLLEVYLDE